ncbi:MAG: DUF5722 domain-containing protein [Planctomycetaceae bacterium]|jgi:hypothetical protein|nr:DUF5722 domain-containing protein [Planctomycetaceae bacterium]
MKIVHLIVLLAFSSLFGGETKASEFPKDAQVVVVSAEIALHPRAADSNQIEFHEENGDWVITTKGTDPYLFIDAECTVDIHTHYVLSFESFNTTESLPLVIFVGNVLDILHLVEGYALPRTEGWTSNSYDISVTLNPPTSPFTSFRIRFGNTPGKTFRVKNFKLREPTEQEKELAQNREHLQEQDAKLTNRLKEYMDKKFTSNISSIQASYHTEKITIQGTLTESNRENIGLAEIPFWKDVTDLKEPETFIPLNDTSFQADTTFQIKVDRKAEDKHDRLLSGWVIVRKLNTEYELLSALHYVDDIEAKTDLEPMIPRTLKGIGGCPMNHRDMIDLDIASVTFNILLDRILYTEAGSGRIPYTYAGKTYYADINNHLKEIDRDMAIAGERGWMVSVILLIPVNRSGNKNSWLGLAAHPETEGNAAFSMPNFTSREGSEAYAATINFLAERYSTEKQGRIHRWIIHNEIQNGFYWSNAGRKTKETYMNLYQKSMRTVQLLACLYDPNAKTLISLDHDWNRTGDPRGYRGKELLDLLVNFSRKEGDFEWGIAYHPYAQDINNPRTWEDSQAIYSYNTPFLTFKNLEVLDAWTSQEKVLYRGKPREIQFTEQGLNSPDYSEKSLRDQAAAMVYTWKKIEKMKNVTAFQYHLWADVYEEGGLKLGLRKYHDTPGDPHGKKPIWYLFQAYGTSQWEEVSNPYKTVLGINDWEEVIYKGTIN